MRIFYVSCFMLTSVAAAMDRCFLIPGIESSYIKLTPAKKTDLPAIALKAMAADSEKPTVAITEPSQTKTVQQQPVKTNTKQTIAQLAQQLKQTTDATAHQQIIQTILAKNRKSFADLNENGGGSWD